MTIRYYLSMPDFAARAATGEFAFVSHGAEGLADELETALRSDGLFQRWRAVQEEQHDLQIDLIATTSIPSAVLKHRLRLLAGNGWQLRDVTAA
jgi:hypothetical protein